MTALTLPEAAHYLRLKCPNTLRRMAKRGDVPARIVGKEWRFCTAALDLWLAGDYVNPRQEGQVDNLEKRPCQSLNAAIPGGLTSPYQVESRYNALLNAKTAPKPKSCTTKSSTNSGGCDTLAKSHDEAGKKPSSASLTKSSTNVH